MRMVEEDVGVRRPPHRDDLCIEVEPLPRPDASGEDHGDAWGAGSGIGA